MSTHGTKESRRDKHSKRIAPRMVWVVVKVFRGFPDKVRVFREEEPAQKQLARWRKGMNFDYDDADIFKVPIQDALAKEPHR